MSFLGRGLPRVVLIASICSFQFPPGALFRYIHYSSSGGALEGCFFFDYWLHEIATTQYIRCALTRLITRKAFAAVRRRDLSHVVGKGINSSGYHDYLLLTHTVSGSLRNIRRKTYNRLACSASHYIPYHAWLAL